MGTSPTPSPTSQPKDNPVTIIEPPPAAKKTASPLLLPLDSAQDVRRPSIQFKPHSTAGLPSGSPKLKRPMRRMSSPPPPPVFRPRVSFDTFDKPADLVSQTTFTLIAKHKDYEYTKRSRTFLCGCDDNEYSEYALQWLIDELVDDGDEIVCLRVIEQGSTLAADHNVEKGRYRSEAEDLMKQIQKKNHENKAINLILEFAVGKVNKVIDDMINVYEPAILVVGTRGRSLGGFQGLLPGSVSKYCLQHSPVPVIVVRPTYKRDKARSKRAQDPNRHGYKELLEKSGSQGGHLLDTTHLIVEEDSQPASEDEAAAVAAAIGYKPSEPSPLGKSQKKVRNVSPSPPESPSSEEVAAEITEDLKSPGVVMKSPELQNLDSPDLSDVSSSEDEAEEQGGVSTSAAERAAGRTSQEERASRGDDKGRLSPVPRSQSIAGQTGIPFALPKKGSSRNASRSKSREQSPAGDGAEEDDAGQNILGLMKKL